MTKLLCNDAIDLFYSDGHNQAQGGCLRNFRNRPYPVRIKARYFENVLTVSVRNDASKRISYESCRLA
jgi:mannose-binding lectin 1